jgi:ribosomal protein L12E/L44/L45/RPP1/RPP2
MKDLKSSRQTWSRTLKQETLSLRIQETLEKAAKAAKAAKAVKAAKAETQEMAAKEETAAKATEEKAVNNLSTFFEI